jgi:hypothetical protein
MSRTFKRNSVYRRKPEKVYRPIRVIPPFKRRDLFDDLPLDLASLDTNFKDTRRALSFLGIPVYKETRG